MVGGGVGVGVGIRDLIAIESIYIYIFFAKMYKMQGAKMRIRHVREKIMSHVRDMTDVLQPGG